MTKTKMTPYHNQKPYRQGNAGTIGFREWEEERIEEHIPYRPKWRILFRFQHRPTRHFDTYFRRQDLQKLADDNLRQYWYL